jgi:hypothetical protein
MAALYPARPPTYAAIYGFSQDSFTTCLVMAAEMGQKPIFR